MLSKTERNDTELKLLNDFNEREEKAFSSIYLRFYVELNYYARSLFYETEVDSNDVVQDCFVYIWEHIQLHFKSLNQLKAFLIIAIRNAFNNYVKHSKVEIKFYNQMNSLTKEDECEIFESRLFSQAEEILGVLPHECARVVKLYLEGYDTKEIAEQLSVTIQTVYNRKSDAIRLLRLRLSQFENMIILCLLG